MVFLAKASKDGGIEFETDYNEARFKDWLKENPGKKLRIEPYIPVRSKSQNAFYWMYLGIVERETGNLAVDLHEYFRRTLLPPKFITAMGREIRVPTSTTELSKVEFGEYMDKIAAETGVAIPDTQEYKDWIDSAPEVGEEFTSKL